MSSLKYINPFEQPAMTKASSVPMKSVGGFGYSPVGLNNIGNTCFMASILQCIFATAPLTQYLIGGGFQQENTPRSTKLTESYLDLLKNGRASKGGAVTPSALKSQVSRVAR